MSGEAANGNEVALQITAHANGHVAWQEPQDLGEMLLYPCDLLDLLLIQILAGPAVFGVEVKVWFLLERIKVWWSSVRVPFWSPSCNTI